MKTKYVVGIILSDDLQSVLLIEKKRPDFMVGKYNAIGGHIEKGEEPVDAMCRETLEECGLEIRDWVQLDTVQFETAELTYFVTQVPKGDLFSFKSLTDEKVSMFNTRELPQGTLGDIKKIIEEIINNE